MDVLQLAQDFSKALKIAKNNYCSGKTINLQQFNNYIDAFKAFDLENLKSDKEKKAFFINVYNGFTNYSIIKLGLKAHMKELPDFFKRPVIRFQNHKFSLDDIEHGLLRKNARQHLFSNDERLKFALENLDYRIHFALNCGAHSCPSIAYYSAANIEAELDEATSIFVENEFKIDKNTKTIICSKIFVWYKIDFKNVYLNNPKFKEYTIVEKPYSWLL